jgi:carbamate kinase
VDAGVVVVCAGGGGVPVVCDHGRVRGVEAVVDKDLAANMLAQRLRAAAILRGDAGTVITVPSG